MHISRSMHSTKLGTHNACEKDDNRGIDLKKSASGMAPVLSNLDNKLFAPFTCLLEILLCNSSL